MSDLQPSVASELAPSRDSRRAGRRMLRQQSAGLLRMNNSAVETDLSLSKLDDLTAVTGQAMADVVRVAQAQRALEALAPESSSRLALLADDHAIGLSEVAADHRRRLRRI